MAKKTKSYSHPGGVIAFPRYVLRSDAYKNLSVTARALIFELQDVWRPREPSLHYSVRRAAEALGTANGTAANAFSELDDHGFIKCVCESDWFSGKAREWRLNWLSYNGKEPSNEWMEWNKNE